MMLTNNLSSSFESLPYGVLVIDSEWNLHQINREGIRLVQKLNAAKASLAAAADQNLPSPIKQGCQRFAEICINCPEQSLVWQEVLILTPKLHLRLCIQWLERSNTVLGLMLVIIENLAATAKRQARCDAIRYGLTQREEEYWALACQGFSQQEIKDLMYISINTVKKYARSVNFKRNI